MRARCAARNKSAVSRDRAYAGLVMAIYGPTPFDGANTTREVATRYRMTDQNLNSLAARSIRILGNGGIEAGSIAPAANLSLGLDPLRAAPPEDSADAPADLPSLPDIFLRACLQEATQRLTPALLYIVHQPTVKKRDRALAALSVLVYGPEFFGPSVSVDDVAVRYGVTGKQLNEVVAELRSLISPDNPMEGLDGEGI